MQAKKARMEVDVIAKEIKSLKNAEKRRMRSMIAARCRRGRECDIFTDLTTSLPLLQGLKSTLDKASVLRLTLCDLHLKKMMKVDNGYASVQENNLSLPGFMRNDFQSQMDMALDGFILIFREDGDVVYASEGIATQLGILQHEIMGQSIFDFCHQFDHADIRSLLKAGQDLDENKDERRSALFRMKCTASSLGKNAPSRSSNFKVVNCTGRMVEGERSAENKNNNKWFISTCHPLPHPSHVDIPLNKQTFLSMQTPDMKFSHVDDAVLELLGYTSEEMVGKSLFEFIHAADLVGIGKAFKSLYEKEQNQTDRYRFLTKGGGWVWVVTQSTVMLGGSSKGRPSSVVCIHHVTSGREEESQILSQLQICDNVDISKLIEPVLTAEEEELFISDLLLGPVLNNTTYSTSKIFMPKTKDMEIPYLDDTLVPSLADSDDLTHLAPMAGDECVSLEVPILDDLLASLDEDNMSYSFLDDESEIQEFDIVPPMPTKTSDSKSSKSPLDQEDTALSNSSFYSPLPIQICKTNSEKSISPPLPAVSPSIIPTTFAPTSPIQIVQQNGTVLQPEMLSLPIPVSSLPNKVPGLDESQQPKVYILVPADNTTSMTSPTLKSSKFDDEEMQTLLELVRAQQVQLQQQALLHKKLLASMNAYNRENRGKKRSFDESFNSESDLFPQNCEVDESLFPIDDISPIPDFFSPSLTSNSTA